MSEFTLYFSLAALLIDLSKCFMFSPCVNIVFIFFFAIFSSLFLKEIEVKDLSKQLNINGVMLISF